ncbi:MAG: hypothetical protein IPM51_09250 [Sphingobacteriaceae bacterium]|nr:hypothetical protein [Sphingobacteriaceae bacterium]
MKTKKLNIHIALLVFYLVGIILCTSCTDEKTPVPTNPDSIPPKKEMGYQISKDPVVGNGEGFAGIFNVPEMLALCVKDSAPEKELALRYAQAFTKLEMELLKLEINSKGSPGSIAYNNNPMNFVFECIYLIDSIPKKQPKDCQVVVLEASTMYIYNFYGEYKNLYLAYEQIKDDLKAHHLEQVGPMREFYVTDPVREKDSTQWLTRILVPIQFKK